MRLVDAFMGEAVAARPIRAVRAGVAFGVVDTFLVRAADDAVGHDHGASLMLAKEGLDLLADNRIVAYIAYAYLWSSTPAALRVVQSSS